MEENSSLFAGAAKEKIEFPEYYFPITDGFAGVHDDLHVRVIYLESGGRVLLVSVEMTSLIGQIADDLRDLAAETVGLEREQVWLMVTHTFSAPHYLKEELITDEKQREENTILRSAVEKALRSAVLKAMADRNEAALGRGIGSCQININRDILTEEGWWLGHSPESPSDKQVHVIRVNKKGDEEPIAILFHYGIQSSATQKSEIPARGHLISADIAGSSSRKIEEEFQVPAMFLLGAAGDQVPILSAVYNEVDAKGRMTEVDLREEGYFISDQLGRLLGSEVVHVASGILCHAECGEVEVRHESVFCMGQKSKSNLLLSPSKKYQYELTGEAEADIELLRIGAIVLVGTKAELSCESGELISKKSPFNHTLVCTMVNGGAKYMARREAYDLCTYEAINSPFACGSAERWEKKRWI